MFAMEIEISLPQKAVDVGEKMADAMKEDTGHFFDHWYNYDLLDIALTVAFLQDLEINK